jgi:uncharacterized protein
MTEPAFRQAVTGIGAAAELSGAARAARIWWLVGEKMGDNAQVRPILETMALPFEEKRLFVLPQYRLGKPTFKVELGHLDLDRSDRLEAPWPDLVITSGRRMAMAALWIKEQSGGSAKVVLVGRPRRWLERFDLVVGPSQYRLPNAANVLRLDLPLMRPSREAVAAAAAVWKPLLGAMKRPLIAVLIGGQTKPFRLDPVVADDLIRAAEAEAGRCGGSLYFTTSRRTPAPVADRIERRLPVGARLFRWRPDAQDNPYLGLLALADLFIVTGDSASMMVEVARLGRKLVIYPLPVHRNPSELPRRILRTLLHAPRGQELVWWRRLLQPLADMLDRLAEIGYARDLTALHDALIRRGMAVRIGEPPPAGAAAAEDELAVVVQRISALLGSV